MHQLVVIFCYWSHCAVAVGAFWWAVIWWPNNKLLRNGSKHYCLASGWFEQLFSDLCPVSYTHLTLPTNREV